MPARSRPSDAEDAIARGFDLSAAPRAMNSSRVRASGRAYAERLPAVVAGQRRILDVLDVPTRLGSAGIAIDATEAQTMRAELASMVDAHRRTLDQLATGVAIFAANQILTFYNAAYRSLWDLDAGFLDRGRRIAHCSIGYAPRESCPRSRISAPGRSSCIRPIGPQSTKHHEWHLPDGRTLRVVTTPNPEGGVTYLFDNVTERLDLERRYDALIRVQRETLDNLTEALAVFGSDGRVRLHNPAFSRMWKLMAEALAERPHIEAVIAWCRALYSDDPFWHKLRVAVTAIEHREAVSGRLDAVTAAWSTARPYRSLTARPWSRSRTSPIA